jgi:8-oxo-dGTP pyrophosphatase MutT (NUDIX family)
MDRFSVVDRATLFGYLCIQDENGNEEIFVQFSDDGRWCFPIITQFDPQQHVVSRAIDSALTEFQEQNAPYDRQAFYTSEFYAPEVRDVVELQRGDRALFFKIRLDKKIGRDGTAYRWLPKRSLFEEQRQLCDCMGLLEAVERDCVYEQYGLRVLECVDMLVFVLDGGAPRFLLLRRYDSVLGVAGWEYPKGGIAYHETIYEGARRELREETGVDAFQFRGYLGHQTIDVDRPGKNYTALRVHGLTYLYTGALDSIKPQGTETLRTPTWMPWQEAHDKVWMKTYSREFFERWQANREQTLAGLV